MQYLVDILDKEVKVYADYLELAARKKSALIANDIDSLEAITIDEKGLTAKVLALEAARIEYIREQGYKTDLSIDDLIKDLKGAEKKAIRESADSLKEVLVKCKKFNEDNMALMRQSSNYINHMIRVFSKNISDDNPTYTSGALKLETGKIADMQG